MPRSPRHGVPRHGPGIAEAEVEVRAVVGVDHPPPSARSTNTGNEPGHRVIQAIGTPARRWSAPLRQRRRRRVVVDEAATLLLVGSAQPFPVDARRGHPFAIVPRGRAWASNSRSTGPTSAGIDGEGAASVPGASPPPPRTTGPSSRRPDRSRRRRLARDASHTTSGATHCGPHDSVLPWRPRSSVIRVSAPGRSR